jgi:AraC-like DNA-binding protein
MKLKCPYCSPLSRVSGVRPFVIRRGTFRRKSDSRVVRRFQCRLCERHFSASTHQPAYRQKKRHKNYLIGRFYCSGISLRRAARELHLSRTTVARKIKYLGEVCRQRLEAMNRKQPKAVALQFDDQETFEHTKCKPLSITLAVESETRRILGFEVSQMAAKGHLSKIALKKYGPRRDTRSAARARLFEKLQELVEPTASFTSDENPHYPADVKRFFPQAKHETFKGQRGSIAGQGELKKVRHDPLFWLNHTCAMTRANINRLFRKTWCTTKNPARLADHLAIYAVYHNENLKRRPTSTA